MRSAHPKERFQMSIPYLIKLLRFSTKQKANSAEKKKTELTEISIDYVILLPSIVAYFCMT
jgi:hypothetical protein